MAGATLRVIVGHEVVREIPVDGPITVGRRRDNTLVLEDESISGHHGVFEPHGAHFRYVDLGSMNGSLVAAGPRLRKGQSVTLDDVTQIMLGKTVLEFRPADGAAQPASGAAPPAGGPPDTTTGLGPGLWGDHDQGQGLIHTPAVQPPVMRPGRPAPDAGPRPMPSGEADAMRAGSRARTPPRVEEIDLSTGRRSSRGSTPGEHGPRRPSAASTHDDHGPSPAGGDGRQASSRRTGGTQRADAGGVAGARPPSGPPPGHARVLAVLDGGVQTLPLPAARCVLGRAPTADLVLEHGSVSDHHAEFHHLDGRWTVRDLSSTNGTRLGVAPLTERRPLAAVSHLIVGAVDLLFVHDGGEGGRGRPAAEPLVRSLRGQGRLSRREAKQVLDECRRESRPAEEVLVRRGILPPGAAIEAALSASAGGAGPETRWPAWEWALVAALAGAVAWSLLG
ncbi:MAG: FHA domain-containing protein [Planctomycetes bacterium]|nr:FHA domain-containing protein [Planctomycetota bacterium]